MELIDAVVISVAQGRYSRWRPRWPPKHEIWKNYQTRLLLYLCSYIRILIMAIALECYKYDVTFIK